MSALARFHRFQRPFTIAAGDVFWPLSAIDYVLSKLRALYCLQAGAAVCLPVGLAAMTDIVTFARAVGASVAAAAPARRGGGAVGYPTSG